MSCAADGMTEHDIVQGLLGIVPDSPLGAALSARTEIMRLTEASHDAVLRPRAPGGLSHGLRAALACRMARQNGDGALAAHYAELLQLAGATEALRAVAEPGHPAPEESRLAAIIRHADLLTREPRAAGERDIAALREAGVAEADIVRLAELAAFLSYQCRLVAGLRLLATAGEVS